MLTARTLRLAAGLFALVLASPAIDAAGGAKPCAKTLASCPDRGCAKTGSSDALVNKLKRSIPAATTPIRLTLDDVESLQDQADDKVGQKVSLSADRRKNLRNLTVSSGKVSEGDLVQVKGYVITEAGLPRANSSGESVNCRLKKTDNNDFHIPIAREPEDSHFDGIVVEMIPQGRPDGWTVKKLKKIGKEKREVLVRGQLFYDNKHVVNDNAAEPIGGQPARFSLWEVHPVTEFLVCKKQNQACDENDAEHWQKLEDF